MKNIKIYVDLDGVLCNFKKAYEALDMPNTPRKFRIVVSNLKIFENLEWMENGKKLLTKLGSLGASIEILTSRGTLNDIIGKEAIRQKNIWLDKNNINYPRNFVKIGLDKRNYSMKNTYLIDDTPGVVNNFNLGQGTAILYDDSKYLEFIIDLARKIHDL